MRAINRLMCVGEARRFALGSLAIVAGEWLLAHNDPEWVERYSHRIEESRLPRSQEDREAEALLIGRDGSNLLMDLYRVEAPAWLREIPAVLHPAQRLDPKLRLGRGPAQFSRQ